MRFGASSDIGLVRAINQDSYYIPEDSALPFFIVADGMGGHNAGEIASVMAIDKIREWMVENSEELTTLRKARKSVMKSIEFANRHIYNHAKTIEGCNGMGTTLTMAYVFDEKIVVGHVGDSRAYMISSNEMVQITQDHSLVQQLLMDGKISKNEADSHPQKNVITRAVGTSSDIEVDVLFMDVKKDDTLILCSDGLTNMVSEDELKDLFINENDMQIACEKAIDRAKLNGGSDNITVLGIRF